MTSTSAGKPAAPVVADTRGARVVPIPPPAYYVVAFAAGMLLQNVAPLDVPGRPMISTVLGSAVLIAGLALDAAGVAAVITHRTTIVPHRPVAKLITSGVYRFSRNPMYTGLGIMVGGGALVAGTWWPLILLPPALLAVRRLVIQPEEAYLAERYGSIYADYRFRVRRWL